VASEIVKTSEADRVHQVFQWILSGASEHEIAQAIAEKFPNVGAKPLIVSAMKRIEKSADADASVVRGWAIESTRQIYQQALAAGDHANALRAIKQLTELAKQ
jgi:hypothetical protein